MATYLALTTTNYQQEGYYLVAHGSNKAQVRQEAEKKIGAAGTDIYKQTEQLNLIVISKSEAKRKGYYDFDNRFRNMMYY